MITIKLLSQKSEKAQINIQSSIQAKLTAFAELENIEIIEALHRALDFAIEYSKLHNEIKKQIDKHNERISNENTSAFLSSYSDVICRM